MTSPSGISLRAPAPRASKVRRSVWIGAMGLFIAIGAFLPYSCYVRRSVEASTKRVAAQNKAVQPAIQAGHQQIADARKAAMEPLLALGDPRYTGQDAPGSTAATQSTYRARTVSYNRSTASAATVTVASYQPPDYAQAYRQPVSNSTDPAVKAYQDALSAPLSPGTWTTTTSQNMPAQQVTVDSSSADQDRKVAFVHQRMPAETALPEKRIPQAQYTIVAPWYIPASTISTINSDLPGQAVGQVRENVYDTATGMYLLIPQGAKLMGTYDSHVAYGQNRVQIIWEKIVFPPSTEYPYGSTMSIDGMGGYDGQGSAGLHGRTDNHYRRIFGTALLTSAFYAASALAQNRRGTILTYPSPQEIAGSAAAQEMTQEFTQITRKNLNIQPTNIIGPGFHFDIFVNRDMVFDAPYK